MYGLYNDGDDKYQERKQCQQTQKSQITGMLDAVMANGFNCGAAKAGRKRPERKSLTITRNERKIKESV